jgi:hypothetical protein
MAEAEAENLDNLLHNLQIQYPDVMIASLVIMTEHSHL